MRFRPFLAIAMAVSLTAAACTSSPAEISTTTTTTEAAAQTVTTEVVAETVTSETLDGTDGSGATSCDDVADDWIVITQEFINVFGAGPYED